MQSNSKVSPKSCSCAQCLRGKHTKAGHVMMKCDERANRHAVKSELDKLRGLDYNYSRWSEFKEAQNTIVDEIDVGSVPIGNYYD